MHFALNSICVHSQVPKEFSRPGPSLVDDDPPPPNTLQTSPGPQHQDNHDDAHATHKG